MSEWRVVDPRQGATQDTKIVQVDVPLFRDDTDYEGLMGRHLTSPYWDDFFRSGGVVILATERGAGDLRRVAESGYLAGRAGVRSELERLALARQLVALRRL